MTVLISKETRSELPGRVYTSVIGICENREVAVTVVSGKSNYVNVIVKNASHKAWRGMGKDFATMEEAINNYKCPKIKAVLSAAF